MNIEQGEPVLRGRRGGRDSFEEDSTGSSCRSSRAVDNVRLGDVLSFLKDVQKFLDRLDLEDDLSMDCRELKNSLTSRIEFYTKLAARPESGVYSSIDLPPPPSLDDLQPPLPTSPPPGLYSPTRRVSGPLPPPPISCLSSLSLDQDDSLGYCTGDQSSSDMDLSGEREEGEERDKNNDEGEDYDRILASTKAILSPITPPGTPPAKTSTPRGKRSSGFLSRKFENIQETPNELVEEHDEYDIIENTKSKTPTKFHFVGTSARILNTLAEHKGWLWKKESIFKTPRFWALIYEGKLYLYNECQDEMEKDMFNLEEASLKKHKKGVKFIVNINGTYKNKNARQEFQTENVDQTEIWISALENAIATAGKHLYSPSTQQGLPSSLSSENDEEGKEYDAIEPIQTKKPATSVNMDIDDDEEYDVVEVNRSGDYQDYDVPKPKINIIPSTKARKSINNRERLSNSSMRSTSKGCYIYNEPEKEVSIPAGVPDYKEIRKGSKEKLPLALKTNETSNLEESPEKPFVPPRKCSPLHTIQSPSRPSGPAPQPSPRKISIQESVRRKLFSGDEEQTPKNEISDDYLDKTTEKTGIKYQFSSKTLQKPKKKKNPVNDVDVTPFRPRNKSVSLTSPQEAMSSELAMILEKRRQNLPSDCMTTKPDIPVRPSFLALADTSKDTFPPYSKVNKASKVVQDQSQPKFAGILSPNNTLRKQSLNSPEKNDGKSFLHSMVQTGKLGPAEDKGW